MLAPETAASTQSPCAAYQIELMPSNISPTNGIAPKRSSESCNMSVIDESLAPGPSSNVDCHTWSFRISSSRSLSMPTVWPASAARSFSTVGLMHVSVHRHRRTHDQGRVLAAQITGPADSFRPVRLPADTTVSSSYRWSAGSMREHEKAASSNWRRFVPTSRPLSMP